MHRFFLEADRLAVTIEFHYAITLWIAHLIAENAGTLFQRQRFTVEIKFPVKNVIAQNQRRPGTTDKFCADQKSLRYSFRFRLFRVFQFYAKSRAVTQKFMQHR